MRYQPIYDIAETCARKGITEIVLCPGSRCAPLTLAFTRHPAFKPKTFSDERSAAFIGLGMAQASGQTVAIICTSGTAAYNFSPAVAEAHFSNTPLLILTADRPAEWIGQHDGQTIYQTELYGRHVKKFFQLPQDYEHPDDQWAINRMINEAINLSRQEPKGPVHVNLPFKEPLYPSKDEKIAFSKGVRIINEEASEPGLNSSQLKEIAGEFLSSNNILIVAGQQGPNRQLESVLQEISDAYHIPVVVDVISNLNGIKNSIKHADLFLAAASDNSKQALKPDLLITFGNSLISKNTKLFLRKVAPVKHWHIQAHGEVADTFKTLTKIFRTSPMQFFSSLIQGNVKKNPGKSFQDSWGKAEVKTGDSVNEFIDTNVFSEIGVVGQLMRLLPKESILNLANSMSVRYANFVGLDSSRNDVQVFSNRGTSGIDGCTSTAVGHALYSKKPTFLITGDLAFFYDRNAFWHNYPMENLRVLVLNNHGGLIFNVLDGPSSQPEAREFFITRQPLTAEKLCQEFNFTYLPVKGSEEVDAALTAFTKADGGVKIMEIETDVDKERKIFNSLKDKIKLIYE